jgi:hypothetical protein
MWTGQFRSHKWEEYRGTRYYDGNSALVVELWLHRVADDLSGLTFQNWDPSAGTDDTSAPVAMLVNSTFRVWVTVRLYSPWKTTMTSGQDVSEYLDTLGLVK